MLNKPDSCGDCVGRKWDQGQGFVPADGQPLLGVAFMLEAGGKNEAIEGRPVMDYAAAGSVLRKVRRHLGYTREQFLYLNAVNCHPPENWLKGAPWERECLANCRGHRDRFLEPFVKKGLKVIVALGGIAMRTLTGQTNEFLSRGYPFWNSDYSCWVVPSLHPAYLARGKMNFFGVLEHDVAKAVWIAEHGVPMRSKLEKKFIVEPSLATARSYLQWVRDNPNALLSIDIENPRVLDEEEKPEDSELAEDKTDAPITQIQFSHAQWEGIVFSWHLQQFKPIIKELLRSPNPKIGHNWWRYDGLVLQRDGWEVRGEIHDSMVMFQHYQSNIPGCYGLQATASFFGALHPWKHLVGVDMGRYGCYDVSEPHRIYDELRPRLEAIDCWKGYMQKVKIDPILIRMGKRGLGVDTLAQNRLREHLTLDIEKRIQELTEQLRPLGLLNTKQKLGLKKEPKSTKGLVQRWFEDEVPITQEIEIDCKCKKGCQQCNKTRKKKKVIIIGHRVEKVLRWAKEVDFTTSDAQVKRYCRFMKYQIPYHRKEDRETTDEKALEELWRKTEDPFFPKVLALREIAKLKSAYTGKLWTPGRDGRVHSTFGHLTASGQLTSQKPNTQQIPAQTETAAHFRRCIVSSAGRILVKFDYSAFHALMTGYCARDPLYMRMARLDFHSFFTLCGMLKLMKPEKLIEQEDSEILEIFKHWKKSPKIVFEGQTFKQVRDFSGKRTVLGYGFGMEGGMLFKTYPEFFPHKKIAQAAIDSLNGLVPVTAAWRQEIVREAHRLSRKDIPLVTPHGYCRWFYEAMQTCTSCKYGWINGCKDEQQAAIQRSRCKRCKGEGMIFGREAKEAIAFGPANRAHGHLKEKILRLEELNLVDRASLGGMVNYVHDDVQLEMKKEISRGWAFKIWDVLESPSEVLIDPELAPKGLSVKVEVKWGKNLEDMEELKR